MKKLAILLLFGMIFASTSIVSPSDGWAYFIKDVSRNINLAVVDMVGSDEEKIQLREEIQKELELEVKKEENLGEDTSDLKEKQEEVTQQIQKINQTKSQNTECSGDTEDSLCSIATGIAEENGYEMEDIQNGCSLYTGTWVCGEDSVGCTGTLLPVDPLCETEEWGEVEDLAAEQGLSTSCGNGQILVYQE